MKNLRKAILHTIATFGTILICGTGVLAGIIFYPKPTLVAVSFLILAASFCVRVAEYKKELDDE